jgi:hypothetical protein
MHGIKIINERAREKIPGSCSRIVVLPPFALHGDAIHFDVQDDETPQLIQFEVHPEFFGF